MTKNVESHDYQRLEKTFEIGEMIIMTTTTTIMIIKIITEQHLTMSQKWKWKFPRNDKLSNFWLYHLASIHETLEQNLPMLVNNDIKNYTLITCLTAM